MKEAIYLQSMTDFVLEQKYITTLDISQIDFYDKELNVLSKIRNYANFLKQPLQLGFFVPCDENGNVLSVREKPNKDDYWSDMKTIFSGEQFGYDLAQWKKYEKAKEHVLFKGFEVNEFMAVRTMEDEMIYIDEKFCHNMTIESFLNVIISELELTETAIKQIGL